MDDLISRQVVLKELEEYIVNAKNAISEHPDDIYNYNSGLLTAIQVVTDTPSAQSERKKGKWIDRGDYCICNQCRHTEQQFDGVEPIPRHTPFCAGCGADMREENDNIPIEYYENGGR